MVLVKLSGHPVHEAHSDFGMKPAPHLHKGGLNRLLLGIPGFMRSVAKCPSHQASIRATLREVRGRGEGALIVPIRT